LSGVPAAAFLRGCNLSTQSARSFAVTACHDLPIGPANPDRDGGDRHSAIGLGWLGNLVGPG
jgi:hypothetical protein